MEQRDIKYGGYSTLPSDYRAPEGDLALALNVVPEDGALKPLPRPKTVVEIGEDYEVVFVHVNTGYTHYIVKGPTREVTIAGKMGNSYTETRTYLHWLDEGDTQLSMDNATIAMDIGGRKLLEVESVGNTLVVLTDGGIEYALWRDGRYKYLGNKVPTPALSMGLVGHPRFWSATKEDESDSGNRGVITVTLQDAIPYDRWHGGEFSESEQTAVTSQLMAKVNKFLAEQSIGGGRFSLPFFVRYALRLYDGSTLMCHSAPILMMPTDTGAVVVPILTINRETYDGGFFVWNRGMSDDVVSFTCDLMLMACDLDYGVLETPENNALRDDWGDIVKSIDFFVTKPIYTWDQNGNIKNLKDRDAMDQKFVGTLACEGFVSGSSKTDCIQTPFQYNNVQMNSFSSVTGTFPNNEYREWDYATIYALYMRNDARYPAVCAQLPELKDGKISENLESAQNFYLLASVGMEQLPGVGVRKVIEVADDYLQSLVARETMTDDYQTNDRLVAKYAQSYNSRLNLSGVSRELFKGYYPDAMLCRKTNAGNGVTLTKDSRKNKTMAGDKAQINIKVLIEEGSKESWVGVNSTEEMAIPYSSFMAENTTSWARWLYYPNVNAKKMRITCGGAYEVTLKPHDFLNGAYALLPPRQQRYTDGSVEVDYNEMGGPLVPMPNKIYTSEVNNPFYFPLKGINTVGTGRIMGIATATKALSQGQFGQFPLYAFASDGVWALEVSSTGTYTAKQPVAGDVVLGDGESIIQIDNGVLFASDRGIMLLEGSTTQCVSEGLQGNDVFDVSSLRGSDKVLAAAGLTLEDTERVEFMEYIRDCRMVYDYTNQRIMLYNPGVNYSYVYSLKSKAWGMQRIKLKNTVRYYPHAYATDSENRLLDLSRGGGDSGVKGLIVTRPFSLDMPDVLKTVNVVLQRGKVRFCENRVKQVLYGSRDLYTWHVVGSSGYRLRNLYGSPYKYFRLALVLDIKEDETLWGCSVGFTPKLTNKMR